MVLSDHEEAEQSSNPAVMTKIIQRRRQLHLHSTLYYHLHDSVIPDNKFDRWANELRDLQREYPELAKRGYMAEEFADWTGDTGMHLPVDYAILDLAHRTLNYNPKSKRLPNMAKMSLWIDWESDGESAGWQEEVVLDLGQFQFNDAFAKRVSDYVGRGLEYLAREVEEVALIESTSRFGDDPVDVRDCEDD
jgi:hypothetical protein